MRLSLYLVFRCGALVLQQHGSALLALSEGWHVLFFFVEIVLG